MPQFDILDKVALVTGGASGLGLLYAINLLEEGARGVTLADIDKVAGAKALEEIEKKYGANKAIFVYCNVERKSDFEDAFVKTIEKFQNIDILINNAGILNDHVYEKEIAINVNGVAYGVILGLDKYIPQYKSGPEGLIVNISSIAGVSPLAMIPIYVGTKFAVHGMTLSWGDSYHYNRTKVRVVGVCPGVTDTPLIQLMSGRNLGPVYQECLKDLTNYPIQAPGQMANRMIQIIKNAPSGTMWIVEGNSLPFKFELPNYQKMKRIYLEEDQ
ncbi:15-hydroxyprostaglandin dehydrogenase [NAD(+)]-like [Rhynchophorus ferrugineus]|uniref:15-hydroxyprostaglandin dehydrogenase [NAD(+)]-like n=1 Tax=Rhynchophorus ferrugineus TaxID=354439 RepID=UPI003FCD8275